MAQKKPEIKLNPDPMNPNRMSAEDKERMRLSLAEFGDLSGVTLNRRTGLLVCGHQRADVLTGYTIDVKDLGKPEADGTVARGHLVLYGRRYAMRVVDWSEEKAHAALLAANRFGRVGQDDADLLKGLLDELNGAGIDTDLTGFDADALAELLNPKGDEGGDDLIAEDFSVEKMCIIVTSKTTEEQRSLFEELTKRGLSCRLSSM
jgi:hypothetical protein